LQYAISHWCQLKLKMPYLLASTPTPSRMKHRFTTEIPHIFNYGCAGTYLSKVADKVVLGTAPTTVLICLPP
jgi:hypothetical protein